MDEIHRQLLYMQQVSTWVLVSVALLTFLGLVLTFWAIYLTSGFRQEWRQDTEGWREEMRQAREDSKRLSYYLFGKLGPFEP